MRLQFVCFTVFACSLYLQSTHVSFSPSLASRTVFKLENKSELRWSGTVCDIVGKQVVIKIKTWSFVAVVFCFVQLQVFLSDTDSTVFIVVNNI